MLKFHAKIGSYRTLDPVASTRSAYDRPLGKPQLLWCEPTADAYRDEIRDAHVVLGSYRVWPRHEIFAFDSPEECLEVLADFTRGFRERTADDDKPAVITDLNNTWLPQQRAAEECAARKRARAEAREERQQEQQREQLQSEASQEAALDAFLAQNTVRSTELQHPGARLQRQSCARSSSRVSNVKGKMESRGVSAKQSDESQGVVMKVFVRGYVDVRQ